ncbi:MAG: gliding motility-associated C-terminal domain-containing protein [Chitinophagaceae bacterium]|nr:gliding motility-associated C-terminal domain-containing protein [Chitinophagaceae bacterium]
MRNFALLIFLCSCCQFSFSQVNLSNGLVAYYPFNGTASDASGNNINGTVNSASLTSDKFGQSNAAYYFDGSTSYIQLPYSNLYNFTPQDSFTISVDVLPDAGNAWPAQAIVVKSPANPDFNASQWNYGTYVFNYKAMSGYAATLVVNGSTLFTTNPCWYNIIVTYKNGIWHLYVNGVLEDQDLTQTFFILQDGPASKIAMGKKGDAFGDFYKGKMDEVRLYHRVLNADEISALSSCNSVLTCNNWLETPSYSSNVTIGDIDVNGDQLTVEALVNVNSAWGNTGFGKLVSKHTGPSDVNYSLMPYTAEITTTNGYKNTPVTCMPNKDKVYHVAMVYDGTILKFYRNGFLMSSISCTGNLITNDFLTTIGEGATSPGPNYQHYGYMNEIRIWNVARTQAQIQQYMNSSLPSPGTQTGLMAYYIFDNLLNKQGNAAFNGTLAGAASINATVPQCNFIADSCVIVLPACSSHQDFSFTQNICNPNNLTFSCLTQGSTGIEWDFGDGATSNGSTLANHTYGTAGTYNVQLVQNTGTCMDTVIKSINVSVINSTPLVVTNNTTICPGASLSLQAQASEEYCWWPAAGLSSITIQNPVATPSQTTTYYLNASVIGNNLINNGNFSLGNTGFTSQYIYAGTNTTEGEYYVGNNPQTWNAALSNCIDHTSGSGNMLLVNGSPTPNLEVWKKTITVTPNTNYSFSTWIQALGAINPAQLQFSINGNAIGSPITASLPTCTWAKFRTTWNSGNNTTANISIINKNILVQGNDFALDDISFAAITIRHDSVTVFIDNPDITASIDTAICKNQSVPLSASGAVTYTWSPPTGLNNPNIANPVAGPLATQQYIVTGVNALGCIAKDTVLVSIKALPNVKTLNDTSACINNTIVLTTTGAATYSWSPAAGLNNPNISNPVFSGAMGNYVFYVTGTAANGCIAKDTVNIAISGTLPINSIVDTAVCPNKPIILSTTGASTYSWSPATGLNNPNIANPIFSFIAAGTYTYYVTGTSASNCTGKDTIVITVKIPPIVKANADTSICNNQAVTLSVTGAISYTWSPSGNLNNPNTANPVFNGPAGNHVLYVSGTGSNGCSNRDSVAILVTNPKTFLQPPVKEFCFNGSVTLDGANGINGVKYTWAPSPYLSNLNSINPIANPPATQNFQLTLTDLNCNKDSIFTVTVRVIALPNITVTKSNDISCATLTAVLFANGASSYTWQPAGTLSSNNSPATIAHPSNSTMYVVTGKDENGCTNKDSILVNRIAININDYQLPSAFTPNDDGRNECFGIKKWGFTSISEFRFVIFNRFGNKVFETNDPANCWNGKFQGQPADAGAYVFQISGKTGCGPFSRKGNVILLR